MILQGSCGVKYNQRTEERRLALAVRAHPTIELLEDRLYVRVHHMFSRILYLLFLIIFEIFIFEIKITTIAESFYNVNYGLLLLLCQKLVKKSQ